MIFVTVGTHEQPFNRLIQKVDELKKDGVITEDVIIQTGFSTYEPKYCQWSKLIPYQQMIKNVADARIVITHGGPASFIILFNSKCNRNRILRKQNGTDIDCNRVCTAVCQ